MKKASDQGDMIFWYLVFAGLLLLSLAVSFDSLFDVSRMQSGWPWVKAAPLVMLLFWSADHARAFAERARAKVDPRFRK